MVVNYLLWIHAIDEIIAEINSELQRYHQPETMNAVEYSQALWTKALRCGTVYTEDIEGLQASI